MLVTAFGEICPHYYFKVAKIMKRKIVVFPNDAIEAYYKKGEIKPRYFNPCNFFNEIHIISLYDSEIDEKMVKEIAGTAKLKIYFLGDLLKKPWNFFNVRKRVFKLVTRISPQIIRAYNPHLMGYLAVFCGKKLRIPSVLSIHIDHDELRDLQIKKSIRQRIHHLISKKYLEPYALSNANRVICVSNFLVPYAQKHGAKNIEVIYNKVDSGKFYTQRNFNQKKLKLKILSVGQFVPRKNQECLIKAIKNLDVNLSLIGDGPNYGRLKQLAKDLDISEKVNFIGSVPNQRIQKYYWEADIFALSSFSEGFCIPILEAMAASLPVVVNNKEPLPEVLGGTGMVVEDTPKAFEEAFRELISNSQLRKELGEKARKRALEVDGEIMEKKEVKLYMKLLKKYNNEKG